MTICRTINRDKVRQYCIENNYYTCGDCEEYEQMLDKCSNYDSSNCATDEEILDIARDIWEHSDMDEYLASGGDWESFVWGIFNYCIRFEVIA